VRFGAVTKCDKFGDEAEGKAVNFPFGTAV
jgi:hypothetical protein